jgi:hypothetical protein
MEWNSFDLNYHVSFNVSSGRLNRMGAAKTLLSAEEFDNYPF